MVAEAVLLSWNFDLWVVLPLVTTGAVYLRGWLLLRRKLPQRFNGFRLVAFQSGLIVLLLASSSPIDAFAGLLLFVHMIQHILLTMAAPPLLLLGAPMLPLLRGLPRSVFAAAVGPALGASALRGLGSFLVRPGVAFGAFSLATIAWHVPVLYELALRSDLWHDIEHICFFGTGLLFWWPVIQPWPSRPHWSGWAMILYLLAADLVNTAVSAVLCFAERVLYPTYAMVPSLWHMSALADQAVAGAMMWVAGSMAFLLPVGWILSRLLEPSLITPPRKRSVPNQEARGVRPIRARFLLFPLALISWQAFQPQPALSHHGGAVQFKGATDRYVITLFSEGIPIYEGPVELSVLVQTAQRELVLNAEVGIELRHNAQGHLKTVATRAESSNKLMYGTEMTLPAPGLWQVDVRVRHEDQVASVAGNLIVEPARATAASWLYWLALGGASTAAWITWRKRRS